MFVSCNNSIIKFILNNRIINKYIIFLIYVLLKSLSFKELNINYKFKSVNFNIRYPISLINLLFISNSYKNSATSLFVHLFLDSSSYFIDVGANEGNITAFAEVKITRGKIFAFEPDIINFKKLSERFKENKNLYAYNVALSDNENNYLLKKSNIFKLRTGIKVEKVAMSNNITYKLDSFEKEFQKVDLIKIDTEGHDYNVINGSLNLISNKKPVLIVEINDNDKFDKILSILSDDYKHYYKINNKDLIKTNKVFYKIDKNQRVLGDIIISQYEIDDFFL